MKDAFLLTRRVLVYLMHRFVRHRPRDVTVVDLIQPLFSMQCMPSLAETFTIRKYYRSVMVRADEVDKKKRSLIIVLAGQPDQTNEVLIQQH